MSQTIVVLERPQEFANGLFFSSAPAHCRVAAHSGSNEDCVTEHIKIGSRLPFASGWSRSSVQGLSLADRLLAIGRDCAARLKEPFRSADHGDLLYDADYLDDRDTSALIAILHDEPEALSCAHAIENSVVRRVSALILWKPRSS
jgi:hypothetical protein